MKDSTFQWTVIAMLVFVVLLSIFNAGSTKERKMGSTKYSFLGKEIGSFGKETPEEKK